MEFDRKNVSLVLPCKLTWNFPRSSMKINEKFHEKADEKVCNIQKNSIIALVVVEKLADTEYISIDPMRHVQRRVGEQ